MNDRDPRVQRMIDDPDAYFAEARSKAHREAVEATEREKALRRRLRKERRRGVTLPVAIAAHFRTKEKS